MAQTPLQRLILSLQYTHGLDPSIRQALLDWLGGKRLSDPRAVAYLMNFYPDPQQALVDAGAAGTQVGPVTVGGGSNHQTTSYPAPASPGGAQGGARDNQPGVAGYNDTPVAPGGSATGAPGYGSETQPMPPVGGGNPPPVRAVPAPGAGARAAQTDPVAGGLAAQWSQSRGAAPPMNPVPTPSAAPTQQSPQKAAGSVVGPMAGGGGISDVQGLAIGPGADNDFRLRQALKAAGVDPNGKGLRTEYLKQVLAKPIAAQAETLGLDGNGADPTTYLDNLKNAVLSFITPGRSGFGEQRALAQRITGGGTFQDMMGNLETKQQTPMYQNLLQMMYGGENGALQSAAQNVFSDTMNQYQDDQIMGDKPFSGLFSQYAQRDPKSSIARILAGLYGR